MAASRGTTLPPRVCWLIAGACAVSILFAREGMHSIWDVGVFESTSLDPFLFRDALALTVAAAIAAAALIPTRTSRWLSVAVWLPVIHLGAIVAASHLWSLLQPEIRVAFDRIDRTANAMTVPSLSLVALVFAAVVVVAIAIKRRHGEWAHATVMLALTNLLLLGAWLPIASWMWTMGESPSRIYDYFAGDVAMPGADRFIALALIPPALAALAFTIIAFRRRRLLVSQRDNVVGAIKIFIGMAFVIELTAHDNAAIVYLKFSYLVIIAVVLAVSSLVLLTAVTWLRSRLAHRALRKLHRIEGVIVDDTDDHAAAFEITSWLRGPSLLTRSYVVETAQGAIPVGGAELLTNLPLTTTQLHVGGSVPALLRGNRVVVAAQIESTAGHPFRAMDAATVAFVTTLNARPYRFTDVALVVWRPCVAYLAILVAAALPGLAILLSA